jgi:hypothetical protein
MDDPALVDLGCRAEFERQQFALYDTRRLSAETHANAVIAAAIAVAAFVLADYGRQPHAHPVWLVVALLDINANTFATATNAWDRLHGSGAAGSSAPCGRHARKRWLSG